MQAMICLPVCGSKLLNWLIFWREARLAAQGACTGWTQEQIPETPEQKMLWQNLESLTGPGSRNPPPPLTGSIVIRMKRMLLGSHQCKAWHTRWPMKSTKYLQWWVVLCMLYRHVHNTRLSLERCRLSQTISYHVTLPEVSVRLFLSCLQDGAPQQSCSTTVFKMQLQRWSTYGNVRETRCLADMT